VEPTVYDTEYNEGSGSGSGDGSYFTKITSMSGLESGGTYLIVYETSSKAFNGALTTLDANNNSIDVTISSDKKIEATSSIMASTFTITAKEGGYSIKSASNYYIGSTSSNGLRTSTSDIYANCIEFNVQGNVLIGDGSSSYYLYFNTSANRFRFYASGQKAIQLYKLVNTTTPVLTPSDLALTGAPVALSFDLNTNSSPQVIHYTTSSTGAVTVSGGDGYVTTSVSGNTITVTPTAVTPSAQTITVNQAADETYAAGSATFTVTIDDSTPAVLSGWVETPITDLTTSDVFVIVGITSSGAYALPYDGGTSGAPVAIPVTVEGSKIASNVTENIKWNISGNATNGYVFYPNGSTTTWLYCNDKNDGVRIGTGSNKKYKIEEGYLKHITNSRYLGIYNSQDWRCYSLTSVNIGNQTIKFYKYVAPPSQTVSVGDAGYATYCSTNALDFTDTDIKAYVGSIDGTALTFTPINQVPANTGLLLVYAGGKTEDVPVIASAPALTITNCLTGVNEATTLTADDYILNVVNGKAGFYKAYTYTSLAAHRAYISHTISGVKNFVIDLDDNATTIGKTLSDSPLKGENIYNLAGQMVNGKSVNGKLPKGIYIVGGKKVLR
jgi:hypothetical protein